MKCKEMGFSTRAIHGGDPRPLVERAINLPIFQSSTYETLVEDGHARDAKYMRLNNSPNHIQLAEKAALLECAEAAVLAASGMAAISVALLGVVGHGEHLLAQEDLYGGTLNFLCKDFPHLGRQVTFLPLEELADPSNHLKPNTVAIYCESVSNPLLKIPDLEAITTFARSKGLKTLIDNTFPSPANFNPTALGFDLVLHSATKYLNGHSDLVGGFVVGKRALVEPITALLNRTGGCMDAHCCYLLNRGMKTLPLRMRAHNENAAAFAASLSECKRITEVFYPGQKNHPHHERAKKWFRGFGGVVSFRVDLPPAEIDERFKKLKFAISAPSLGGVETLVTRPVLTSHYGLSDADYKRLQITPNLVRVSVGIEDSADLIEDFHQVLR